jgi:beta-glucosidase-like glycosyl hydrolase/CubicO group peptidase (beta-lactamase class C family)
MDERIAQLFMVAAFSNKDRKHVEEIAGLVSRYNIGGLIFFQGSPVRQASETNHYQSKAKTPLVIGMDAEWGLGMRLDSTIEFPRQMMLGALQDPDLIFEMGQDIARQMKRIGVHINFAPVVDINNNPENPVISNRSFGENPQIVSSYSMAYMLGLQNSHVFAVAKHFPGHGDTDSDSHFSLPVIKQDYKRIDSVELSPFKHLIASNLGGIMIAHLNIPSLDSGKNMPSTLSKRVVTDLLRDSLHFEGLVFTDALNMRGVSSYPSGELEVRAIEAGNDVLVMANDVPLAINRIKQAIASGRITEEQINESCRKMLILKEWVGLSTRKSINTVNLVKDLNSVQSQLLSRRLVENALTVVKNNNDLIPVKSLATARVAVVCVGADSENIFTETVNLYVNADHFYLPKKNEPAELNKLLSDLNQYNVVIAAVMNTNYSPNKNYGVTPNAMDFLNKVAKQNKTILNVFAPPYFLNRISDLQNYKTIIVSYEDNALTQEYSAQLIFGGINSKGVLPVTASEEFQLGKGLSTPTPVRFKYSLPEDMGISSDYLNTVDSIVFDAIKRKAMPGCQILASKGGVIFYHKAFGYHTYDSTRMVRLTDLYDIASVTKVAATTAAMMKLYENGAVKLTKPISDYLPELKKTNKSETVLLDILTHQARLQAGIPFHLNLLLPLTKAEKNGAREFSVSNDIKIGFNYLINNKRNYKPGYFASTASFSYGNQVADSLFALSTYEDTIFNRIASSSLLSRKEYRYSDLGFIYLYKLINKVSTLPLQEFVRQNFYTHLGATTLGYSPLMRFDKSRIVPTELDLTYRQQLIQGYVQDQSASLLGGVSGHAGLFSNANDLAKLFQMFLNGGSYGGEKLLESATIDYFNSTPFITTGNRRGIGFDKPELNPLKPGPTCYCVSPKSYGHSGFTGTFAWADPESGLVYIFLSNRVYPSPENNKLAEMNIRSKVLEVFTNSIREL